MLLVGLVITILLSILFKGGPYYQYVCVNILKCQKLEAFSSMANLSSFYPGGWNREISLIDWFIAHRAWLIIQSTIGYKELSYI